MITVGLKIHEERRTSSDSEDEAIEAIGKLDEGVRYNLRSRIVPRTRAVSRSKKRISERF